jgi:branched-chain amino acid transport system substrate-binding protein
MRILPARRSWAAALFISLGILAASCGRDEAPSKAAPVASPVTIGAILPLSGENASFGLSARNAYSIAEEDARAQGRPVPRLVYGDSKLDKDLTQREFRRLVDRERIVALAEVTGSGCALALAPTAAAEKIPFVSGIDTSPELTTKGGAYFFRVIASDSYSTQVLARWAMDDGLDQAAMIFNPRDDWATGFKEAAVSAYRAAHGNLVDDAIFEVDKTTTEFNGAISAIRERGAKCCFVGLMGKQAGNFVAQAVSQGYRGPFLGVDNFAQQEFTDAAKDGRTGARFVLPAEANSPAARAFSARYKALYNRDADAIALKAYDAYWVLLLSIESLQKGGVAVTGEAIRGALEKARVEGLTGTISFDANHDLATADYARFTLRADGTRVPAAK